MSGSQICKPLIFCLLIFLFYDIHFVDEAFAVAKLVNNEENITYINIYTALQVVVEVYVAAQ